MTATSDAIHLLRCVAAASVLVLAATLALPGATGVAEASHLDCGDTVSSDTTLDADIGPCDGDGLIIDDDNVTLDLDGHTISGLSGQQQQSGTGAGVLVDGVDGATVTNTSTGEAVIENFDGGVVLDNRDSGSGDHEISNLTIRYNQGSESGTATSEIWGEGIGLWESSNNTIKDNEVDHNGRWAGIGLYGDLEANGSSDNTVERNKVRDNDWNDNETIHENIGIRIEPYSNDNHIEDNLVTGSGLDGIAVFAFSEHNDIIDNKVEENGDLGDDVFQPHNHLAMVNRFGDGIRLHGPGNDDPNADNQALQNTVKENRVCGNHANGIAVAGATNDILDNTVGDENASPTCELNAVEDSVVNEQLNVRYHDLHDENYDESDEAEYELSNASGGTLPPPTCTANTWSGNATTGSVFPSFC